MLLVMSVEAITVLARQKNHFRITRAVRPVFFVDTYLMVGVRRSESIPLLVCGEIVR